MRKCTSWLAVIIVAVAGFSASAEIEVPPGFVVDTLLDQIDGTTPYVEAIRNPDYGFGVVVASVDNGIFEVLRISDSSVEPLGTLEGFPEDSAVRCIRFDTTGLFADALFASVAFNDSGEPPFCRCVLLQITADGLVSEVVTLGSDSDQITFVFDFTTEATGYSPGAYLYDSTTPNGQGLYHLAPNGAYDPNDPNVIVTVLESHLIPDDRNDLDIRGMEFDPTSLYGSYLTMADCENWDALSAIYQLDPNHDWLELIEPVSWSESCYRDVAFSPGNSLGAALYVADAIDETISEVVDPNGTLTTFATGFYEIESLSVDDDGRQMFVSDANGVYRIRAVGPTLIMREPWVEADDVHTGESGVDSLWLLWSEPVLFEDADIVITNEDEQAVPFAISDTNSQFMIIAFGQVLLCDQYTITIRDSVVSAETGAPIDGDDDGLAGGDALLIMKHRNRLDHDNDIDLSDLAALLAIYGTTCD
ncbi:MAG: hypothetical protein KKI02_04965 [Planctomycetes bacterium]|nr:hypothetical protein [Planctomycetota bacterium]